MLEKKYLQAAFNPSSSPANVKIANMFLAEDRNLSLGLFCSPGNKYILKYIPNAVAKVDAVDNFPELIH